MEQYVTRNARWKLTLTAERAENVINNWNSCKNSKIRNVRLIFRTVRDG